MSPDEERTMNSQINIHSVRLVEYFEYEVANIRSKLGILSFLPSLNILVSYGLMGLVGSEAWAVVNIMNLSKVLCIGP